MHRFFRFTTRELLILSAAVSLLLAVLSPGWHRARQERRKVEATARLIEAAKVGDAEAAKRALRDGADIEVSEFEFQTGQEVGFQLPLRYAIEGGHLNVLDVLAEAGCDPSHPMHLRRAAQSDRADVVKWLLAAGKGEEIESAADVAAFRGNIESLKVLLAAGARGSIRRANESSLPRPLKLAVLQCLLDHRPAARKAGFDDAEELAKALDHAVHRADAQFGDMLCEAGMEYTMREAIAFDRLDDVRQMLAEEPERLNTRLRPDYGMSEEHEPTPLGMAARLGRREIALELIARGARVDRLEPYEETMLHMAARGGDTEIVKMMLARGLDVNAGSNSGTPLYVAIWHNHEEAVQTLLDAGADVNLGDGTIGVPIYAAVQVNSAAILEKLVVAGADVSVISKIAYDRGQSVGELIARLGHAGAVEIIDEALKKQSPAEQAAPGSDPPN